MGFKVSCPACEAVLRPTKPMTPGQKVKCPKCGNGFTFKGPVAEEDDAPPAPGARRPPVARRDQPTSVLPNRDKGDPRREAKADKGKPAAAKKRSETRTTELPPQPRQKRESDSDEIATYGVLGNEEQGKEAKVNYAPDRSIRDLRGPAAEAVTNPSNKLIFAGGTGLLGWLILLMVLMFPVIFPPDADPKNLPESLRFTSALGIVALTTDPPDGGKVKPEDEDASLYRVHGIDLIQMLKSPAVLAAFIALCVAGMTYSAVMAVGAVKMQNLESRHWGMAAAIMVIFPLNIGGMLILTYLALNLMLGSVYVSVFSLTMEWISNIALGIWILMILTKDEVVAGYEYVPDR